MDGRNAHLASVTVAGTGPVTEPVTVAGSETATASHEEVARGDGPLSE